MNRARENRHRKKRARQKLKVWRQRRRSLVLRKTRLIRCMAAQREITHPQSWMQLAPDPLSILESGKKTLSREERSAAWEHLAKMWERVRGL